MKTQTTNVKGLKRFLTRFKRANFGVGEYGNGFDSELGYAISTRWNTPKYTPKNYALSTNLVGRH